MEHTTCAFPWLGTLFVLQAQQLQAINVGLNPLFAVVNVFLELADQVGAQRLHVGVRHVLDQVCVERVLGLFDGAELNLNVSHVDANAVSALDLNLDLWLIR